MIQAECMRQVLGPDALGRPRGIGWRGRQEGGLGWGTHVNPWLIHVNVWQKPLQYCKAISLQLIKMNGKTNKKKTSSLGSPKQERPSQAGTARSQLIPHRPFPWSLSPLAPNPILLPRVLCPRPLRSSSNHPFPSQCVDSKVSLMDLYIF